MRIRIFITAAVMAAALALPGASSAATTTVSWAGQQRPAACAPWNCDVKVWTVADYATFTGTVELRHPIGSSCPVCLDQKVHPIPAWQWTGSTWKHEPIAPGGMRTGHLAHAAPFAQGWAWIWTAELGWRAVSSHSLVVARSYTVR